MSIISEYKLTNCSMKLIEYLFYYRGMTALQLTQMYYEFEKPLSTQKSNIHNYLSKLKKQKIVVSKKIEDPLHPGSIYYLTKMGFEVVKALLNIDVGAKENGFILLKWHSNSIRPTLRTLSATNTTDKSLSIVDRPFYSITNSL